MTQLGRVLGNEMLCVRATNAKLKIVRHGSWLEQIDGIGEERAYQLLSQLNWDLRKGLLVALVGLKMRPLALAGERPFRELLSSR